MKLYFAIILLLTITLSIAAPTERSTEADLSTEHVDDDKSVEREKRSSLMAQILYDELRLRLRGDQVRSPSANRRIASASLMRRRRSTTPLIKDLIADLAESADRRAENLYPESEPSELIEELQEEVQTLSRKLMKRSLMAMILKDTLKQRLEEENKPGRHREIVWGKATRNYNGRRLPQSQQQLIQLTPKLAEALAESSIEFDDPYTAVPSPQPNELAPISIVIRPKAGKA